jgi:hypothetical protein
MVEVPLYLAVETLRLVKVALDVLDVQPVQGYLADKKQPPSLGPP